MSLSNTAVPIYYGVFREAVFRGDVPVNREISMEMNRIDALIANPNIYYDPDKTEGFVKYCENELTLTDGSDLHLLFTFKLWAEQILDGTTSSFVASMNLIQMDTVANTSNE